MIVGWGGVWQESYRRALFEPFTKETGIKVVEEEFGGEYAKLTSQIEAGKITWDLAAFESPQVIQGCDEGAFVKLDWDKLGGRDKQIDYAAHDCGIASDIWSTVLAYDGDKIKDGPKTWADFWDVAKWPGKRGCYKDARIMIEIALMADGVKKEDIYKVLADPAGFDRAFKKLDELKPNILWAESAADGMQRLLAGDVAMIVNFNARVSGAAKENKRNLVIAWDSRLLGRHRLLGADRQRPESVGGCEADGVLLPPGNPGGSGEDPQLRRADARRLRHDARGNQGRAADLAGQGGLGGGL